jgi:hypothetical protein
MATNRNVRFVPPTDIMMWKRARMGALRVPEVVEVQAAYWRNWLGTFTAQAEEVRALLTKVADTAEPIKAHVTRGMNELHKAS